MTDDADTIRHLIQRNEQQAKDLQTCWAKIARLEKLLGRKSLENERLRRQLERANPAPAEIWRQITGEH